VVTSANVGAMPKRASSSERSVFRVEISDDARRVMQGITDDIGITQIQIASRIIIWLSEQPDEIKAGVIGGLMGLPIRDPAELFLKSMADDAA